MMAYPHHHPGMNNMYPYSTSTHYQRQNPLLPPVPLMIPQNMPHSTIPHPTIPQSTLPQPLYQQHAQQDAQYNMPGQRTTTTGTDPPQTPRDDSEDEEAHRSLPDVMPTSRTYRGRAYALEVIQQPDRARMCGFGDKDRRPISAPPCVKLTIYEAGPGQAREIDYHKIDDLSRYVLNVYLVSEDGLQEKDIVSHPQPSPSISTVVTTGYPPTRTSASPSRGAVQDYPLGNLGPGYANGQYQYASQNNRQVQPPQWANGANSYGNEYGRQYQGLDFPGQTNYSGHVNGNGNHVNSNGGYGHEPNRGSINSTRQALTGTLIKNLIGSLAGSAFKLNDLEDKAGLWFVFQDLSIRTEGWFRLRFNLHDLKDVPPEEPSSGLPLAAYPHMLAEVYSRPFKVYSAKKFPGVIESTELSKKFAEQGIKIPIRKDTSKEAKSGDKRKRGRRDSDGDEEGSEDEVDGE